MKYNIIGKTDIQVSQLGLGTVKFGRNTDVKYPSQFDLPSDKEIEKLIGHAKTLGINLIDTAPAYGLSEARLGNALKGQRQDWIICTKAGEQYQQGESTFDFTPNAIRKSVEHSLRTLKTDYIDLLLVHSDGHDLEIIEQHDIFATLAALKKQGHIRAYGISTKTVAGGVKAAALCDCVMATYHIDYQDEKPVLDACLQHQTGVFIKKALGSGHLACAHSVSDCLRFVYAHPATTSVITGTLNAKHLSENAGIL